MTTLDLFCPSLELESQVLLPSTLCSGSVPRQVLGPLQIVVSTMLLLLMIGISTAQRKLCGVELGMALVPVLALPLLEKGKTGIGTFV